MVGLVTYAGANARARHRALTSTFWLRLSPRRETLTEGSSARFRITIRRQHFPGAVRLQVVGALPRGASIRLSPRRTRKSRATLILATSARTPPGTYVIRLRARRGKRRRTLTMTVTVANVSPRRATSSVAIPPFTISGGTGDPLTPGTPRPIDLTIANPGSRPLTVDRVAVSIAQLTAPQSTAALPCTLSDFTVQQYSGSYPLVIPPGSARSLQSLGVPATEWPQVEISDLPRNQDGCQQASLVLAYAGDAALG